jgi:hypothetical protein
VEVPAEHQAKGVTNPDYRVDGKLREVKSRDLPGAEKRWFRDQINDAGTQLKESTNSERGDVELQLRGDDAAVSFEQVEREVRRNFNANRGSRSGRALVPTRRALLDPGCRRAVALRRCTRSSSGDSVLTRPACPHKGRLLQLFSWRPCALYGSRLVPARRHLGDSPASRLPPSLLRPGGARCSTTTMLLAFEVRREQRRGELPHGSTGRDDSVLVSTGLRAVNASTRAAPVTLSSLACLSSVMVRDGRRWTA